MSKKVEDYVKEGMLGPLENKPDERRKYLGTLRERIVVALTQSQVRQSEAYKEPLEEIMKQHKKSKLFLNGNMDYSWLSDYIKLADKHNVPYTMKVNPEYNSEFGLILASRHAVDKEDILLNVDETNKELIETEESGIKKFFEKLF